MATRSAQWTMGVEEEYQVIDPTTRALISSSDCILSYVRATSSVAISTEMQRSQIEIATPVCSDLLEVRKELYIARKTLIDAAEKSNLQLAAAGTHPFTQWQELEFSPQPRYFALEETYQQLAREQMIFGCHVHIGGYENREQAIQILNRARNWLGPLLALTANSPFWQGTQTGYASYRTLIWGRWPMAGPPGHFSSIAEHDSVVEQLIRTESIPDASFIYWDIRLSEHYPTIEFRVTDVCQTVDDAVMLAGLICGLVQSCAAQIERGLPYRIAPTEILRMAQWRAARYGLEADLIDVDSERSLPAAQVIEKLLLFVRPALENNGSWDEVSALVQRTLERGNGAMRQRQVYAAQQQLQDVVDFVVRETNPEHTTVLS